MQTLALVLTLVHGAIVCSGEESVPRLILVSFDGFRADYLLNHSFPNLQNFIDDGVLVREVTNVFITKTFPNHYSIVTGLYAESHGIVANAMYDRDNNQTFSIGNFTSKTNPMWWNEATPIWVTNQRAGGRSGSAMWPGTDVRIQNVTLNDSLPYDTSVSFEERVDNITSWFTRANDPINFATLYFHEPDGTGHRYGPEDKTGNLSAVLTMVDQKIKYLVDKLKELKLWDTVNVIITSDHGMAQCSNKSVIVLDECIGRGNYTLVDSTAVAAIFPLKDTKVVYDLLKNCSDHMKVYLREDIPDRYHYKQNSRIQPIILVADEGWNIVQSAPSDINSSLAGNHGYDNRLHSMHPFLAAHGPAFHKNLKINTINMVDIYPMMCHILGLKAEPNNGTLSSTKCLLADQWCVQVPEAIGIVMGGLLVLATVTCVIIVLLKKKVPSARQFTRLQFQEDDDPLIG